MRAQPGALILAALAGASAWISFGALAVTGDRMARVGAIAPFWVLPAAVALAIGIGWAARLRTEESWPLLLTSVLWLPWLPMPISASMTVWDGPLEIGVWFAAIGGVLIARYWPLPERLAGVCFDVRRAPIIVAAMFFVLSLSSAKALSKFIPGGDEPHYLIITQSLIKDGDLRIQNNHDRGDYFEYFDKGLPPDFLRRGVDDEIYSVHAPGLPALLVPAFALAGYPGSVVFIALIGACGLALAWRAAYELSEDAGAAWAGTLAVGFSAPVFFHSFAIFPDPVGGAIVAGALLVLGRLARGAPPPPLQLAITGTALSLLPWLHTRFAILAAALGAVVSLRLLSRADRWRALGSFLAIPIASAIAWFAFFWIIYGTPNPSAPYGGSQQNSWSWIGRGAAGLAVDQQFGLLVGAPVFVFLAVGWARLARAHRRLFVEYLVLTVPYAVVVSSFGMWWGGWSAPARFLVPILPAAIPLLAVAWRALGRQARAMFIALWLIGCANVAARIILYDGLLLYNLRDGYDLLLDYVTRTVNLPLALPSVHRNGPSDALAVAAIWVGAGLAAFAVMSAARRVRSRGALWALTGLTGIGCASVAMTLSWRIAHVVAATPESSQIEFVRRWRPGLRPIAFELPRLNRLETTSVFRDIALVSSRRPRELGSDARLLTLPWLPAGDYRLIVQGADELAGMLTVSVGTTGLPFERWALDGVTSGETALHVTIPVIAHSLVIRGDDVARARIRQLALRPLALRTDLDVQDAYVIRAARYGHACAFELDDSAYLEPGGLWTRGDSTARLALTSDLPRVGLDLTAGPVPVSLAMRMGEWSADVALAAGERRRIEVPTGGVLSVRTNGRFRPADFDPGNNDGRPLGARLEFPNP